ncbi:pyruvate kinase [Paraburkholderia bryophila]|jgi:pyruvate kinase|uniref:Pyruvate kinase n=2 Tax=Burkholderiaceae TaxID=119060 RepID=A0A329D5J8_9BURK|nr:pyruvate kinase [Paraburkholderia bryophila]
MTKSAKTRGARSPRNTEAAQAGERATRSAATQAAADPTAVNTTETPQPEKSGSPLAHAELTTTGEAAELSIGQAAQSQAELPDDEVALAEPPARPVLVSNTASPHKATLVSTGAQPPAASFGAQPPHPTRSAIPSDLTQTRRLMHRATKIVATIGPASSTPEILLKMIQAGLDVVRLNFSHGTADDHRQRAEFVREAARQAGREVAIMADLQGPKIRVGKFENGKIMLVAGEPFILDAECELGNEQRAGLDYKDLPRDLKPGDVLLLNDGLIVLDVARVIGSEIHTIVKIGGELSNNKGINRQGGGLSAPALTAKDMEDIRTAMSLGVDYVAVSFPKNATDMEMARQLANIAGAPFGIKPKMIAKIERAEAIPALQGILDASDGIMVARGDLAVEVGNAAVPALQKRMIRMARESNKFVITATQMMESMIYAPVPTRAEVSDVANAVLDGTDAVMLSAESAAGKYPVQTIETMAAICVEAEKSEQSELDKDFLDRTFTRIDQSIAMGALFTAYHLGAKAIVALTESGSTALWMSRHWTHVPIFALTPRVGSERAMALYRNVTSLHLDTNTDRDTALQQALETVVSKGYASHGDMVVLTVGEPMGQAGGTNTLKIVRVGEPY